MMNSAYTTWKSSCDSWGSKFFKGQCRDTQFQGVAKTNGFQYVAQNEDTNFSALGQGPISIALDASAWSLYRGGIVTGCEQEWTTESSCSDTKET